MGLEIGRGRTTIEAVARERGQPWVSRGGTNGTFNKYSGITDIHFL